MKWFKHDTDALHDAKIEKLMMKYGLEGYGLYFACIEIIAYDLTADNASLELEHDMDVLAHKFNTTRERIEEISGYCVEIGLFEISENGKIQCLKLIKRLDTSTSNNPNFKKLLETISNYHKLSKTYPRIEENRIEENRIEENNTGNSENLTEHNFKLKDDTRYFVSCDFRDRIEKIYGVLDWPRLMLALDSWGTQHPGRRKTRAGAQRFITHWLETEPEKYKAKTIPRIKDISRTNIRDDTPKSQDGKLKMLEEAAEKYA